MQLVSPIPIFQATLNASIAKSKFSEAIGATLQNDEGFELSEYVRDVVPLNEAYANAAHAAKPKGSSAEILIQVFRIGQDEVQQTLDVTTQLKKEMYTPSSHKTPVQMAGCFNTGGSTCSFSLTLSMSREKQRVREETSVCSCLCPIEATSLLHLQ